MDGGGNVLALGRLASGQVETRLACTFRFAIGNVPRADFYRIEIANREAPTYSYGDLEALDWDLSLSIGTS